MSLSQQILKFYDQLSLNDDELPKDVAVMNPYSEPSEEMQRILNDFYQKYYGDNASRGLILGINPGRFGAGITGIPFTDSHRLQDVCGIPTGVETRETSAIFIYEMIEAFGGAQKFYEQWFIGAVSPLGFIHKNQRGKWVNYNYYDSAEMEKSVRSFIIDNLERQKEICGNPDKVIILGTGKNYQYMEKLNRELQLFKEVIPLEHPRYIMQYKLKKKEDYIARYLDVLKD